MREEVREGVRRGRREEVREGVREGDATEGWTESCKILFCFIFLFLFIFYSFVSFLTRTYISVMFVLTMMIPAGLMFFLPSKNIPKTFKCPGIPLVTHFLSFSLLLLLSSFPFHHKSSLMFSLFLFGLLLQECLSYL